MAGKRPSRASVLLRQWMVANGVTQEVLAERLGVSQTAVSAWLLGSEPRATIAGLLEEMTSIAVRAWGEEPDASDAAPEPTLKHTGT